MTNQSRYSYTTSWAVGRRFRSHRRIAPMSRRCAGANLAISVRNWASADRRATADWVLPGTSTSTWTERRPEASFFTLMMAPWIRIFAAKGGPRPPGDARGRWVQIHRDRPRPRSFLVLFVAFLLVFHDPSFLADCAAMQKYEARRWGLS